MDLSLHIRRTLAGDPSAFAAIVDHYQRPLFGYLGRMGFAQGAAEDLAQEAFLRAWRQLDRYQPERAAFSTWLFTIARHLALSELERHPRIAPPPAEATLSVACEHAGPETTLAEAQTRRRLQAALRQLPAHDRNVLALAYLKELDLAAVATIEGCSLAAVKVRVHRARQRLRALMEFSA